MSYHLISKDLNKFQLCNSFIKYYKKLNILTSPLKKIHRPDSAMLNCFVFRQHRTLNNGQLLLLKNQTGGIRV